MIPGAVHALPPGVSAGIMGRTGDNRWLAISSPEPDRLPHVWIAAADVTIGVDLELLIPVLEP